MSTPEYDPTQNALNEILAAAGNTINEDFESMRERILTENASKGPGVYRVPGMIERNGHRVIIGDHSIQYVAPEPYRDQQDLKEQVARTRAIMGLDGEIL